MLAHPNIQRKKGKLSNFNDFLSIVQFLIEKIYRNKFIFAIMDHFKK